MSETAPNPTSPQPGEFDPVAEAQRIANEHHDQQVRLNEWIGVPGSTDPTDPRKVASVAARTAEYFGSRPTAQDERTYDPRYEHPVGIPSRAGGRHTSTGGAYASQSLESLPNHDLYEKSMPKDTLADATLADLVLEWAQSEVNKDRTRANDIQDRLQERLIESGASANMIDTIYAQKEKTKSALMGAKDTESKPDEPEPAPPAPEGNKDDTDSEPEATPPEPTEPEPAEPPEPVEPPKPPKERAADDTVEMPAIKEERLPNFWEKARIARAKAHARGEGVPTHEGPLAANYFKDIQDLPPQAVGLLYEIAEANFSLDGGSTPSKDSQTAVEKLTRELEASNPGMSDKLIDIYGIGGRFEHENMKLTNTDANFIDLINQYKANERNGSIRKKLYDLWTKINSEGGTVPVNWHEVEDGPITPVEGSPTLPKGDWLLKLHGGRLTKKQFEDIIKGKESEMAKPIGRWGRAGRAILRGARVLDPRSYRGSGVDTSETGDLYRDRGPRSPENPDGWIVPPKK